MEKNKYILLFLMLFPFVDFAQSITQKYILYFKDKPTNTNVEQLFSAKALEKKLQKHIAFDERDYPVNTNYLDQLKIANATILNTSNWLNASLISIDENDITKIKQLPFISTINKVEKTEQNIRTASTQKQESCEGIMAFEDNYTSSFEQFHLLNGEYLHEQGFNGENMIIAICDNGFYNAKNNPAFSNIFSENRLLGTYDYVHGDSAVYDESAGSHGAYCFSFIAATLNNQYIGTASKAKFYLFHTEDNSSEQLQEEFNLATALERCNQLGVDVVSISLGYTTFDGAHTFQNHDTSDMKKNITPGAKAVNIASSKGILVCVASGNEGTSSWHYISTPSDADSAFCIAAVDVNGIPSSFSSYGLATDIRVKPNVAAVGQSAAFVNTSGVISSGNGTSFATPSLAGMATCLWQAFPNKTNWEVKTAIEQSASQYLTPDKKIGYGIPDFKLAYQILSQATTNNKIENEFAVSPNPFKSFLKINNEGNSEIQKIQLTNTLGQVVYNEKEPNNNSSIYINDLPSGWYILQISTNKGLVIKKLLKA